MIGFALVFVLAAVALSAAAAVAVVVAGPSLRRCGPHAERRAVELAAVVPLALALVLVGALVVRSYAGADHCGVHVHHAHLCVAHGDGWLALPWAVAAVAAAAAILLARLAILARRYAVGARAVARLERVGVATGDVRLVESDRAFCFVAGLRRPRIYASTAAWHGLADDERAAMFAHERSHVAHRDLRRRLLMELAAAVAAPFAGALLVRRWAHAIERLRDRDAAAAVGDPEPVARAMVRMCRLERRVAVPGVAFVARPDELSQRVEALLRDGAGGQRAARLLSAALVAAAVAVAVVTALRADALHHALESLLG